MFWIGVAVGCVVGLLVGRKVWAGKFIGKLGDVAEAVAKDASAVAKKL